MEKNKFIKVATINEISDIMDIQKISNENLISYKNLKNDLTNNNCYYLIYYINNSPVGFIGTSYIFSDMDLLFILVSPSYRKMHIATELIDETLTFCKQKNISKILLEVRSKNINAISLYKKFNFTQIDIRKKYYKDDDALIFKKDIIN